jgi:hypothetical protein
MLHEIKPVNVQEIVGADQKSSFDKLGECQMEFNSVKDKKAKSVFLQNPANNR